MKQVLIQSGKVVVADVPAPQVEAGGVLVRVTRSCISIGTEIAGLEASGEPLWKRAVAKPERVKQVLKMAATKGVSKTREVVHKTILEPRSTGYSVAGVVHEVGEGVTDFNPGDRVACAGAQCAHHAEVVAVPRNLVVSIPPEVGDEQASTVALGAIALQGVRRADPKLGETFVVIGLGLLGQLTTQSLVANGCDVIAHDIDHTRVELASASGRITGVDSARDDVVAQVHRITGGVGADGVIITAATRSSEVVAQAFKMCRKKGRVVVVGDVGMDLQRSDIYEKELDFFISTSYGPGRYDSTYEEQGQDYPLPYVRWTENRNMQQYLQLLRDGRITLEHLPKVRFSIRDGEDAYRALTDEATTALLAFLEYGEPGTGESASPRSTVAIRQAATPRSGTLNIALIGAGSFAKTTHLPNIQKLNEDVRLHAVASRRGPNALEVARRYDAAYATTRYQKILEDPEVDAVIIATRHNLHAEIVCESLEAGKHVFVEKPLAISSEELNRVRALYGEDPGSRPVLLTGFNRRFSPFVQRIRKYVSDRTNPLIINYRMNAGYQPLDHWVHTEEGGGRNIGEACHIYDLFTALTGGRVRDVKVESIAPATGAYTPRDNFVAVCSFDEGSVATLTYTALGHPDHPKERMEVYCDGSVYELDDYKRLTAHGRRGAMKKRTPDKGHLDEMQAFTSSLTRGDEWPIPLWQQLQAMEIAFRVEDAL